MKKIYKALSAILLILYASSNVIFSLFLKSIVDAAVDSDLEKFKTYIVYTLAIMILEIILAVISRYFLLTYSSLSISEIKNNLIKKIYQRKIRER